MPREVLEVLEDWIQFDWEAHNVPGKPDSDFDQGARAAFNKCLLRIADARAGNLPDFPPRGKEAGGI